MEKNVNCHVYISDGENVVLSVQSDPLRVVLNNKEITTMELMGTLKSIPGLEVSERKLIALEAAGVDNWDGYDYAMEYLKEE